MTTHTSNGSNVNYAFFPITPKAAVAPIVGDVLMSDVTTESTAEYHPASSSLKTTSDETGYESDDEINSEEGSAIEFYEDGTLATTSGPMRKIKRNRAMTAEQQESQYRLTKRLIQVH